MSYTVTRIKTGEVTHIRAGRDSDAIEKYASIRREELDQEYKAAGEKKRVASLIESEDAAGGYELRSDEPRRAGWLYRFTLNLKTRIPTDNSFTGGYQDASSADWASRKFHK